MLAARVQDDSVQWVDAQAAFEIKYDGIRALARATPGKLPSVRSRNGIEKGLQFPEISLALSQLAEASARSFEFDGEIVAVDAKGSALGFENLQPRLQLRRKHDILRALADQPARLIVFDILQLGGADLREKPFHERRNLLEEVLRTKSTAHASALQASRLVWADGRELRSSVLRAGGEGIVVKKRDEPYTPGVRSKAWLKVKFTQEKEFQVGGYTDDRTGSSLGALLLGTPNGAGRLQFCGAVGSGLDTKSATNLIDELRPLETERSPFATKVSTRGASPHYVEPRLSVRVRFSERTNTGRLRHPVYLGRSGNPAPQAAASTRHAQDPQRPTLSEGPQHLPRTGPETRQGASRVNAEPARQQITTENTKQSLAASTKLPEAPPPGLCEALLEIEERRGAGVLDLGPGRLLKVSNLHKIFWPQPCPGQPALSKGDLLRYYVEISPCLLPVVRDRPLVMRRFPDGVDGPAFYQHRAPEAPPAAARIASLPGDDVDSRFVGGDLFSLLYMAQLGAISQDPWFSSVGDPRACQEFALDLDPMDGVPFSAVNDCALWIHELLDELGIPGFPKTSGATGMHIFVSLAHRTPYEAARLFAQLLASLVAQKHPKTATVERTVRQRGPRVYIDYLQNVYRKTLACAYSARASAYAGASTPVTWQEVFDGINPRDFTLRSVVTRVTEVGDLWRPTRAPENRVDLQAALDRLRRKL